MEIETSSMCTVLQGCSRGVVSERDAGNHSVAQITGPALLLSIASVRDRLSGPTC
jgi:hypothetical protein